MSCQKFHELISEEVDGLLNNEELLQLNEHCKNCILCKKKRLNATKSHNICASSEIKSSKKGWLKIIIPVLIGITACLFIFLFFIKNTDQNTNITDITSTEEKKIEKTDISQKPEDTYIPPEDEIQKIPEENSQIISSEPVQSVKIYEPEPQQEQNSTPADIVENPVQPKTVETNESLPDVEVALPEIPEEKSADDISETDTIEKPENIDLISSEKSRTEIFDAIHAASPNTETVSANSDFELELTKEEFSAIIEYLNTSETEFVISKIPESESVVASFVFKAEDIEEIPVDDTESEPAGAHDLQEEATKEISETVSEETEITQPKTDLQ